MTKTENDYGTEKIDVKKYLQLIKVFRVIRIKPLSYSQWFPSCSNYPISETQFKRLVKVLKILGVVKYDEHTKLYWWAYSSDHDDLVQFIRAKQIKHSKELVEKITKKITIPPKGILFPYGEKSLPIGNIYEVYTLLFDSSIDFSLAYPTDSQLSGLFSVYVLSCMGEEDIFNFREHLEAYEKLNDRLNQLESSFFELGRGVMEIYADMRSYNFFTNLRSKYNTGLALQLEALMIRLLFIRKDDLNLTQDSSVIFHDRDRYLDLHEEINRIVTLDQQRNAEGDSFFNFQEYLMNFHDKNWGAMNTIHEAMRKPFMDVESFYNDLFLLFRKIEQVDDILVGDCRLCREE